MLSSLHHSIGSYFVASDVSSASSRFQHLKTLAHLYGCFLELYNAPLLASDIDVEPSSIYERFKS